MRRSASIMALAFGTLVSVLPAYALEAVTVTPRWTKTETASGQPITLPQKDVHVVVAVFEIAPGASLPAHKHPFARYAVVQAGSLEVTNVETGKSTIYRAGDFVIEMIGQWHRAKNVGNDVVKLLVIDQVEGKASNTVLRDR